ncbi:hypothetical protein JTE90_001367 [Oedothorax gibbosus]|uniref:Uncharacterized protein n=1 Tax=Oedothorax gibbosus TaxID=931172 RepID=A0AAV6VI30_9ARAC|nr:hypothetical protein JTE90_001367 [Oedothorax gibbosus]
MIRRETIIAAVTRADDADRDLEEMFRAADDTFDFLLSGFGVCLDIEYTKGHGKGASLCWTAWGGTYMTLRAIEKWAPHHKNAALAPQDNDEEQEASLLEHGNYQSHGVHGGALRV